MITCPICDAEKVAGCRCPVPKVIHTLEDLRKGHGNLCANGHRWSGDIAMDDDTGLEIKIGNKKVASADLSDKIIDFITANPNPEDEAIHEFAESLGMEPSELEDEIYSLLTEYIADRMKGGLAEDVSDDEFDARQLAKGILVELEHTGDFTIAKEIAKDHLMEMDDYYDKLETMEQEATRKQNKDFYIRMKEITGQSRVSIEYQDKEYKLHPEFDDYIETGADIDASNFLPIIYGNKVVGGINAEQEGEAVVLYFIATVPSMEGKGIAGEAVKLLFNKFPTASYITGDSVSGAITFWKSLGAEFEDSIFKLRKSYV